MVTPQAIIRTRYSAERPSLRLTEPRSQPIYLQADGTMASPPTSAPTRDPSPSQPDMELEVASKIIKPDPIFCMSRRM